MYTGEPYHDSSGLLQFTMVLEKSQNTEPEHNSDDTDEKEENSNEDDDIVIYNAPKSVDVDEPVPKHHINPLEMSKGTTRKQETTTTLAQGVTTELKSGIQLPEMNDSLNKGRQARDTDGLTMHQLSKSKKIPSLTKVFNFLQQKAFKRHPYKSVTLQVYIVRVLIYIVHVSN
jgi:hypothetical protein